MENKTYKNMWCCVSKNGHYDLGTLAWAKKDSTAKLTNGTSLKWGECYRIYGWRCIKVNVTFEPVKK